MLSDSVGGVLGVAQGSIMNIGGSVGDIITIGLGSLADAVGPVLDGLTTASRQGEDTK